MSRIISIEGNIGAGKSVLINEMRKYYENQKYSNLYLFLKLQSINIIILSIVYSAQISFQKKIIIVYFIIVVFNYSLWQLYKDYKKKKSLPKVVFVEEPVNVWQSIKDRFGNNILELYYSDQKKYAFVFQMMSLYTRFEILQNNMTNEDTIFVIERSINSDHQIFEKMLYEADVMNDIEDIVYKMWFNVISETHSRIEHLYLRSDPHNTMERKNKRNRSGEDNISLEYLTLLHDYHEDMINELNPFMIIEIDKYNIANKPKYNKMIQRIFDKLYSNYE